jgi:HEPN domain-containing protein
MTSAIKTRPATKAQAKRYLEKAQEFLRNGERAYEEGDESAAGLLAIHAGISACDALTAHFLGVRSAGQRHHEAMDLLTKAPVPRKEAIAKQFRRLLDEKNLVEYDAEILSRGDAAAMLEAAKRIVEAAKDLLG